jgi:hypothetical protein
MYKKTIPLLALISLLFSCKKETVKPAEIPVAKTVQFRISQANDYSGPVHDGLKAEVKLSIAKESTLDGRILSSWDTTFSLRSIREFAPPANPLSITRQIGGILQSKEAIRVSRVIRYVNAANQTWQNALGETIPTATASKQVLVNL